MGPCTEWWPLKARASVLLGVLACLAPAVAAGEIYKCRNPQGEIRFQDRPCAAGSTSTLVKQDEPGVQTPAEPVARRSVALRPAPVHVPPGQTYVVDTSLLGTVEWKKAMNRAHMIPAVRTGSARFTLLRVWLDTVKAGESIQAAGGKLRILDQDSGGSRYQQFQSGSFVILEHLGSTARRGNHDSLEVASLLHGTTQLWVELPPPGTVAPLGDIVLLRSSSSLPRPPLPCTASAPPGRPTPPTRRRPTRSHGLPRISGMSIRVAMSAKVTLVVIDAPSCCLVRPVLRRVAVLPPLGARAVRHHGILRLPSGGAAPRFAPDWSGVRS